MSRVPELASQPAVRLVAAIPSIGLLAGSAVGLAFPETIDPLAIVWLLCGAGASLWGWRASRPGIVAAAVAVAFAGGGSLLAADAWQKAWRPTLRVVFED